MDIYGSYFPGNILSNILLATTSVLTLRPLRPSLTSAPLHPGSRWNRRTGWWYRLLIMHLDVALLGAYRSRKEHATISNNYLYIKYHKVPTDLMFTFKNREISNQAGKGCSDLNLNRMLLEYHQSRMCTLLSCRTLLPEEFTGDFSAVGIGPPKDVVDHICKLAKKGSGAQRIAETGLPMRCSFCLDVSPPVWPSWITHRRQMSGWLLPRLASPWGRGNSLVHHVKKRPWLYRCDWSIMFPCSNKVWAEQDPS